MRKTVKNLNKLYSLAFKNMESMSAATDTLP